MADEKPNIDAVLTEEQKLAAELESLKNAAPQGTPPAEATAAEPVQEDPAQVAAKAAEAKAIADAQAAEAAAKPAEAKPEDDEQRLKNKRDVFRILREREKELAEARAALAARDRPAAPADQEPDFETKPADYLKKRIEQAEAELAQVRAEEQRRNYIDGIKNQEAQFAKDHPDYFKATDYLIDKDIKQWQRAGLSTVHTNQVLQAARSNDPRFDGYRQHINRLLNDPGVLSTAEKEGRDPEEVAAFVIARDSWLTTRRDLLAEGARAQGRSVAEVAYEEAVDRGWSANEKGASRDDQAAAAARARVQQAKEVSAASQSLSESATAEAAPEVRVLRNRQQILDLDEKSLDELIRSGAYREL